MVHRLNCGPVLLQVHCYCYSQQCDCSVVVEPLRQRQLQPALERGVELLEDYVVADDDSVADVATRVQLAGIGVGARKRAAIAAYLTFAVASLRVPRDLSVTPRILLVLDVGEEGR